MKSIKVKLWGVEIGLLSENPNDERHYLFEYNKNFLSSHIEVCPLAMKKGQGIFVFDNLSFESFKGLPSLLIDSLPDRYGETLLSIWKEKHHKDSLDPIDVLSYIGKRGMGALEFEPALDADSKDNALEIESLVEVAKEVLAKREEVIVDVSKEKDLQKLIDVGSSIGGARAKAIIAIGPNNEVRSGQIAGLKGYKYCILKFDGLTNDLSEDQEVTYYTRIEYAYYQMAIDCGIKMQKSFLLEKNNLYHFVTERFDRDENGAKIHMLSLAGMVGFDYLKPGENSYEEVAVVLKNLGCDFDDVIQLFRRMVFNVFGKNHDDHVKNISFLMNKDGKWSLSPAYDLSYSYNPTGVWTRHHQMRINGKIDDITRDDLIVSAINMGIKKNQAISIVEEMKEVFLKIDHYGEIAKLPTMVVETIKKQLCLK